MNLDLHVHTDASFDCETSPREAIRYAEKREHLDGFAVTDHDSVENQEKILELAEETDLTVIPGIEISTADGHLLGLNVREKVEPGQTLEDSIQSIREKGGIAVVPHPFQFMRHGVNRKKLKKVDPDAVEAFNSRLITGFRNYQAERYADRNGVSKVCGSDAHVPGLIGTTYTEIDTESRELEDITNAVKKGNCTIHKKKTPLTKFVRQIIANNLRPKFRFLH